MEQCAVSAPGKVLLAGGYLVLDRKYTGLSFGLNARIHVHAKHGATAGHDVVVRSPQFKDAVWSFKRGDGFRLIQCDGNANPFVETAVAYALAYAASASAAETPRLPLTLTVLADDGYYSDAKTKLDPADRFSQFDIPIDAVHKTGLGSSAALVTGLVAATLVQSAADSALASGLRKGLSSSVRKVHNLAQAAHCAAQGKVGSGFDVASAVYGSCKYRRFSPRILDALPNLAESTFRTQLVEIVDEATALSMWDHEVSEDIVVPRGLRMVMCDVDCGSKTPSMVKDVLRWRSEKPEDADKLWSQLQQQNDGLADELAATAADSTRSHHHLSSCLGAIRSSIRTMSSAAGVPIEPEEQTKLLDACALVSGVIGGVVPGAGGYDAIVLLIEDKDEVEDRLRKLLDDYEFVQIEGSMEKKHSRVGLLGVKGETEGLRVEETSAYSKWTATE